MPFTGEEFTRIYQQYAVRLLRYIRQRTEEPEAAADLLAATFEQALRLADRYRGTSERELEGWLWRIANTLLNEAERRGKLEAEHRGQLERRRIELSESELERIVELGAVEPYKQTLARNLARLPAEQRQALQMHVIDELDYEEVARLTNTTEANVRARVSRGLRTLRTALAPDHDPCGQDSP